MEEVLGERIVSLRICMKNWNGLMPPSFSDLCDRLSLKFGDAFTLKDRFDVGKNRAHYVMMDLCNQAERSRYNRVIQGSNVGIAELVLKNIENEESSFDDGGAQGDCGVQVQ